MSRYKIILIILILLLALGATVLVYFYSSKTAADNAFNIQDLPGDAKYMRHPDEEVQTKEGGEIVMRHYAMPDAIKAGGPIYGLMGYRVVSIEYEIPISGIPTKSIGEEFSGYLLKLPEFGNRKIIYDHFHISYQKEALGHNGEEKTNGAIYSIHFMLIPHEEELKFGLVCE